MKYMLRTEVCFKEDRYSLTALLSFTVMATVCCGQNSIRSVINNPITQKFGEPDFIYYGMDNGNDIPAMFSNKFKSSRWVSYIYKIGTSEISITTKDNAIFKVTHSEWSDPISIDKLRNHLSK